MQQVTLPRELEFFAQEARRFTAWALGANDESMTVAQALRRIIAIYRAGLDLPEPWTNRLDVEVSAEAVADSERELVLIRASLLPFQYYRSADEPVIEHQSEEKTIVGSIADDIADIYADVRIGLILFDGGQLDEARWQWGFGLKNHWGRHAVEAIAALHAHYVFET